MIAGNSDIRSYTIGDLVEYTRGWGNDEIGRVRVINGIENTLTVSPVNAEALKTELISVNDVIAYWKRAEV